MKNEFPEVPMNESDMLLPWYVAYSKPHQEQIAIDNLERQRYQTLMPLYKQIKIVRRKWVAKMEPMFPRYIFFKQQSVDHSISPVRSTVGVLKIVRFGDTPATLSEASLKNLLALVDHHNQESFEKLSPFQSGSAVEVQEGPFIGLRGLVAISSETRVLVLMELLGKQQEIALDPSLLRIIPQSEPKSSFHH